MNDSIMNQILQNSPINVTNNEILLAYENANQNIIETIATLWKSDKPAEKPKTKYDEYREICDAYDMEMEKFLENAKKQQNQEDSTEDTIEDSVKEAVDDAIQETTLKFTNLFKETQPN